jgi:drug/metabolite transporter (DMT)-like permease
VAARPLAPVRKAAGPFGGIADDPAPMTSVLIPHAPRWLVHAKLLGMAMLWGASWPAGRILAQALPPLTAAAWRFAIALALFALWWHWTRGSLAPLKALSVRQWRGLAVAGAFGVFGYAVFFMFGLQHVNASRAALIVTINPVFTTLIAAWWFKERFNAQIAAGMALATLGASVVLTRGEPWKILLGDIGTGEALLLGCVACWVAYTLLGRRLLVGIDSQTTTTVTATCGGLMLGLAALLVEGPSRLAEPLAASPSVWVALVFIAAGATVVAYAWYFDGVAELGAGGASAYISLVPVFGVLSSTLWLGEVPDGTLLVGGALAIAGMVLMNHARR